VNNKDWLQKSLDAIDYAGKQKTEEEHRALFLKHVINTIEYWLEVKGEGRDERSRMEGCVFSLLATLDGSSIDVPPYLVVPMISTKDGEGWESSDIDIAGNLHEVYSSLRNNK